jgi:rRNA biogenesis protein RRP5
MLLFAFWRALKTISFREENEKLNVWVAYFNLENEYGNPPEVLDRRLHFFFSLLSLSLYLELGFLLILFSLQEAVVKVFQRALQYNDPKKVHFALLGMYERTEQHKLVDELLDKMIKKFKHSCKVLFFISYNRFLYFITIFNFYVLWDFRFG